MPEKSADHMDRDRAIAAVENVGGQQIENNVVVIAGAEDDIDFSARLADSPTDIPRAVQLEGVFLDANHVCDLRKLAPEITGERNAADFC